MDTYTITVTPDDGTAANWMVEYFEYDGPDAPYSNIQLIDFANQNDGTFAAEIELDQRQYGFAINLIGIGKSIEIGMTPESGLIYGGDGWPITLTGSPLQTRDLFVIIFDTGDGA